MLDIYIFRKIDIISELMGKKRVLETDVITKRLKGDERKTERKAEIQLQKLRHGNCTSRLNRAY